MYDPDIPRSLHADVARIQLQHDFPDVPARVVVAVLDAYARLEPVLPVAVSAARDRITDACLV